MWFTYAYIWFFYNLGRPTEIAEQDVWICESKYYEAEKTIRKLSKGLKVPTLC